MLMPLWTAFVGAMGQTDLDDEAGMADEEWRDGRADHRGGHSRSRTDDLLRVRQAL